MALGEQARALGLAQQLVPNYLDQQLERQLAAAQIGGLQANAAAQQLQTRAGQAELDNDQAYQAALLDPRAQTLDGKLEILRRFPRQAKTNIEVLKAEMTESDKANFTRAGEAANLALRGDYEGAAKKVEAQIAADRSAGAVDEDDQQLLTMLRSGDPEQQRKATEYMGRAAALHAGPEHAASLLNALDGSFTLGPGDVRMDRGGNMTAHSPFYLGPNGETFRFDDVLGGAYAPGTKGGDQASGATGAAASPPSGSPRRRLGWTPRARDGGDNPDHVVDSKIAQLSAATGFNPDAPLSLEQAQRVIAAIPATEGGPNDLPAKLNNPGAIIDGAFARKQPGYVGAQKGYAQFASRDQGMAAAQKLGQVYYNRGQRSIRDIIEGKPVGGGQNGPAPVAVARAGPVPLLPGKGRDAPAGFQYQPDGSLAPIPGGPSDPNAKPQGHMMSAQEIAQFPQLDPGKAYWMTAEGKPEAVSGTDRGSLKAWPNAALQARTTNDASVTNIDRALRLLDPKNASKEAKDARYAIGPSNAVIPDAVLQQTNPSGTNFRALIGQIGGVIIKDISGAAVSATEDERLKKWVPRVTDTPAAAAAKLRNLRNEIMQRNQAMDDAYSEDQGYRPFKSAAAPVRIRSVQEYNKLASGTAYIDPQGKRRVKR